MNDELEGLPGDPNKAAIIAAGTTATCGEAGGTAAAELKVSRLSSLTARQYLIQRYAPVDNDCRVT